MHQSCSYILLKWLSIFSVGMREVLPTRELYIPCRNARITMLEKGKYALIEKLNS